MAGEVQITIVGSLGADPELKFTPSGQAVANFSVASSSRNFDKQTNEWVDGDTTWFRVNVWQQMAEHVAETLTKGMRVVVTGKLKVRDYDRQDGGKGTSVEITADEIGPSLRYATAKVTKAERSGGGQQAATSRQPVPQENPWSTPSQGQPDEPPF